MSPTPAGPSPSGRPFGRVLTAMVTPFDADGHLDLDKAEELAAHLIDLGNDGLVLNGTTGEGPTTTDREKSDLVRAVVSAVGNRATIVAGAGTYDTAHSIELSRAAEKAGAHGLLIVTPYYSRPPQSGLVLHFTAIADATDLPVMLYDVPGRTVVRYSMATLERLAAHPRIVAVKDATADVQGAMRAIGQTGLAYYSGDDGLLLPFLSVGAVGLVSMAGHLVGDQLAAVIRDFDVDPAAARATFASVLPVIDLISGSGNGALRSKLTLTLLGLIPSAAMRLPQAAAGEDEVLEVRAALITAGLLTD
jgi:4-hydroxy-tetrahydrodipicolinate synthase